MPSVEWYWNRKPRGDDGETQDNATWVVESEGERFTCLAVECHVPCRTVYRVDDPIARGRVSAVGVLSKQGDIIHIR